MSRKKIHIDKLFRDGLKNFSLLVTDKDLDAIDDKTSVFKDHSSELNPKAFQDFELEVSDLDWLATKNKLDNEKLSMSKDTSLGNAFDGFEVQPDPSDWDITYRKYKASKRRRVALWWWMSTGVIVLIAGLSLLLNNSNQSSNSVTQAELESIPTESTTSIPKVKDSQLENTDQSTQEIEQPKVEEANEQNINTPKVHSYRQPTNTSSHPRVSNSKKVETKTSELFAKDELTERNKGDLSNLSSSSKHSVFTKDPELLKQPDALGNLETLEKEKEGEVKPDEKTSGNETEALSQNEVNKTDSVNKKDDSGTNDSPKTGFKPAKGYYLAVVNQVAYTDRYLSKSNNALYNSIRQGADKAFMQYFGGIEFGYLNEKGRLNLGVNVTRQTWTSAYQFGYKVYDSLPFRDPQGNIIGYFLTRGRDTSINESRSITINRVEIPMEYNAFRKVNNRLQLSAGFGAVLGFNTSMKGDKILYPVNRQLSYYNRWKSMERTFTFAPSIQVGFQYRLAEKWMLQSNLMSNMYVHSRFKPSFDSKEYPFSIGLNIKLMYLLNN